MDQAAKEDAFFRTYHDLLGVIRNREHTPNLENLGLSPIELEGLDCLFTEQEVWQVIKEMPADRAPGPDGFIGIFYQKAWSVIKHDVMAALLKLVVGDGRGFDKLNRAYVTLIPKQPDAVDVGEFRPISLVHSFSKLFSKLLANRLRMKMAELVSMNQSAFIKQRSLHDNFLLVRQVARKLNARREKGVFLKLDISRAFDSVSWAFLMEILRQRGFSELWIKWATILLSTASTMILVNGLPGRRIKHVRGLRQGDPISPQFFVMIMEVLTLLVRRAEEEGLLSTLSGSTSMQRISIFADDVALFVKPLRQDLETVQLILNAFGEASGLKVNYAKSCAIVIRGEE